MYITTGFLSKDIKDSKTSIGRYLRSNFPNGKPLQTEYKEMAGNLVVDSMGANAGTVGTAVDLIVRLILKPHETPMSALFLYPLNAAYREVVNELAGLVGKSDNAEQSARAAWALALCVSAYRAGPAGAPFVPDLVHSGGFTVEAMLTQADAAAIGELIALRKICEERLTPTLGDPLSLGPTFDLSDHGPARRIAAEADLVSSGLLIDIKTTLAPKNRAGLRPDVLKIENVYQLLGYALLDYSDRYSIRRLGIFSARYGMLIEWPLDRVTAVMSGGAFNFSTARREVWDMMKEDMA